MGRIFLYVSSMFGGKTDYLIMQFNLAKLRFRKLDGEQFVLFKPGRDDRYSQTDIVSHDGRRHPATVVNRTSDIFQYILNHSRVQVIGIDEVQFLDAELVRLCQYVTKQEVHLSVFMAGLMQDFARRPFKLRDPENLDRESEIHMGDIAGYANPIMTLSNAICGYGEGEWECGRNAEHTQRIINGKIPAPVIDDLIVVASDERSPSLGKDGRKRTYLPVCDEHHRTTKDWSEVSDLEKIAKNYPENKFPYCKFMGGGLSSL